MATRLKKPVRRVVDGVERRDLVVALYPNKTVGLRPLRCKREHIVPLLEVYKLAVAVTIEADRRARQDKRDAERAARGLAPRRRLVKRGLL